MREGTLTPSFGRVTIGLLVVLTLAIAVMRVPQAFCLGDVVANAEGARRISEGETVFKDFLSPIGPAALALQALFMRVSFSPAVSFQLASALSALLLGLLAWSRLERADPTVRMCGTIFVAFVTAMAAVPGFVHWDLSTNAGSYNNLSLGLLLVIFVEAGRVWSSKGSFFLFGLLTAVFSLVKFTNAASVVPLVALAVFEARKRPIPSIVALVGGLVVGMASVYLFAPYSLAGYVSSSREMTSVALSTAGEAHRLVWKTRDILPLILGAGGFSCWAVLILVRGGGLGRLAHVAAFGAATFASMVLFDFGASSTPFVFAAGSFGLAYGALLFDESGSPSADKVLGGCSAVIFVCLGALAAHYFYIGAWNATHRFRAPGLTVLGFAIAKPPEIPPDTSAKNIADPIDNYLFAEAYSEALGLVRAHAKPTDILVTDDFTNVAVAGGLVRGVKGSNIAWHWGRNVDDRNIPALREMVAEADWILTWKKPYQLILPKSRAVSSMIGGQFKICAESPSWILYGRRVSPTRSALQSAAAAR